MAAQRSGRAVLMSIHPEYAHAIFRGNKKVEFRKRLLADDVRYVVVYSTSPERAVIGMFSIESQSVMSPEELWDQFGDVGCIGQEAFFDYYRNKEAGVGISVGETRPLQRPLRLDADLGVRSAPQSFQYLDERSLAKVVEAAQ